MEGIFLINKPRGISSREVGDVVKKTLRLNKIGHVGTLDVEASGLLLLLSGRSTRLQNYFLETNKIYSGEMILGKKSSTDDIYGDLEEVSGAMEILSSLDRSAFINLVKEKFSPAYSQMPPYYSAKKKDGKKSYNQVRKGIYLDLEPKEVNLKFLNLEFLNEFTLEYEIEVSSGFYVRSLARDIGELINVGGVTQSITRVSVGKFFLNESIPLDELKSDSVISDNSFFYPLKKLINYLGYPLITIFDAHDERCFLNGNKNHLEQLVKNLNFSEINNPSKIVFRDTDLEPLGIVSLENNDPKFEIIFPKD